MTRLNMVLLLAVLVSSLYLVHTQYAWRQLYTALNRAEAEATKLEIENERLQVERRAEATSLRVEKLAKERLQMRPATPGITVYLNEPVPAAAAASAGRPASGGRP